jgi:hypothetical protein
MISFKQFLNEADLPDNVKQAWASKTSTEAQAVKWLIANNQEALANGSLIYRGFSTWLDADFTFIDSTNGRRVSKDSSGMYQSMMDASEAFAGFPSRSNSFICTTKIETTKIYGTPYVMFPKKNTPIAISEVDDFFRSEISGAAVKMFGPTDIEHLNASVARRLKDGFNLSGFRGASAAQIDAIVDKVSVDEFMKEMGIINTKAAPEILAQIKAQGNKNYFTAMSNVIATPYNFGVEVAKYGKLKMPYDATELWFSGKALVVDYTQLPSLLEKLPPEIKVASSIK